MRYTWGKAKSTFKEKKITTALSDNLFAEMCLIKWSIYQPFPVADAAFLYLCLALLPKVHPLTH